MLGLGADLDGFYRVAAGDARLNALAARFRGMRPPCFPTVFEAVVQRRRLPSNCSRCGHPPARPACPPHRPRRPRTRHPVRLPAPDRLADADPAELRSWGSAWRRPAPSSRSPGRWQPGRWTWRRCATPTTTGRWASCSACPASAGGAPSTSCCAAWPAITCCPATTFAPATTCAAASALPRTPGTTRSPDSPAAGRPYGGLVCFHLLLDTLAARGYLEEAQVIADDASSPVAAKRQRTPVITELLLRPAGAPLRYQPGQYVLLGDPDGELVVPLLLDRRKSAPRRDGLISLLVTRGYPSDHCLAEYVTRSPSDRVLLLHQVRTARSAPPPASPAQCCSSPARSGLAPVRALAQAALRRRTQRPGRLVFLRPHAAGPDRRPAVPAAGQRPPRVPLPAHAD